jgi:hypothetical protein
LFVVFVVCDECKVEVVIAVLTAQGRVTVMPGSVQYSKLAPPDSEQHQPDDRPTDDDRAIPSASSSSGGGSSSSSSSSKNSRACDAVIFGDSWVAFDHCWAPVLARTKGWNTAKIAEGGSCSTDLARQVNQLQRLVQFGHCSVDETTVAIVHSGGNDLHVAMQSGLISMIGTVVLRFMLWKPVKLVVCPFAVGGVLLASLNAWLSLGLFCVFWLCVAIKLYLLRANREHFVIDQICNNLVATSEHLYELGIRKVAVSGLPIVLDMPLIIVLRNWLRDQSPLPCPGSCLHWVTGGIFSGFVNFCRHEVTVALASFAKAHPDCTVLYFDEALVMDSLSVEMPEFFYTAFWADHVHPTAQGHEILARKASEFLSTASGIN